MVRLSEKERALVADLWESKYQPLLKKILTSLDGNLDDKYRTVSPEDLKLLQGQSYAFKMIPEFLKKIYTEEVEKDKR